MAIWQHCSEFWAYFHCACAETAIYELPVKNLTPPFALATSISYKTDVFPLPSDVAWPCDFDLRPFDLEIVSYTVLLTPDQHTNFIILRLSVTELRVLNIWSHFRYPKQSLRMRSITWPVHRKSPKTTRNNFLIPNCLFTIQLLCGYDDY